MKVKATREGLVGQRTASGYVIDRVVPFVALPAVAALGRFVRVMNPVTKLSTYAVVLDVGPHNESDEGYVFNGQRPLAEAQFERGMPDQFNRVVTNSAGIDLGEKVWKALGMKDNTDVEWSFIS